MYDKKAVIYDCAKELFIINGFKDTNIAMITEKANVAVGTFYSYYPSKEKLFFEIFLEENIKLKKQCLTVIDMRQKPLEVISHMMALNSEGFRTNPILVEWYDKKVFAKIEKLFREEHGSQSTEFLYDYFLDLVKQWQQQNVIRDDIDSTMIMKIFTAIMNVDVHKEEIGIEYFPQLLNVMTELIMESLMVNP
ncbi:MAG: TetR/AcrR family transcriptional regulator [Sphaerochaetaceae bacterium]|nr:TetR/AcrR family transcriptional regulator [Sphaerochaetaceae bacterium]